tara:strand:- start:323 stop:928 length:606 start_codon:yes stop_codon:yes gene_type:complete
MQYKLVAIIGIIFLASCSSEPDKKKVTEYKEVGHLIKDIEELSPSIYQQYIAERQSLEIKYLTKTNNQEVRKTEYQKIKESFASDFRDHIDYADRMVPELNIAIERIEEETRFIKSNLDEYIQDLISVNQDPATSDFVNDLKDEIETLEASAADLMKKRVDLFLQFRKFELSQEDPSVQKELNAIIKEAEIATNNASKNIN